MKRVSIGQLLQTSKNFIIHPYGTSTWINWRPLKGKSLMVLTRSLYQTEKLAEKWPDVEFMTTHRFAMCRPHDRPDIIVCYGTYGIHHRTKMYRTLLRAKRLGTRVVVLSSQTPKPADCYAAVHLLMENPKKIFPSWNDFTRRYFNMRGSFGREWIHDLKPSMSADLAAKIEPMLHFTKRLEPKT